MQRIAVRNFPILVNADRECTNSCYGHAKGVALTDFSPQHALAATIAPSIAADVTRFLSVPRACLAQALRFLAAA
ncbi:hypothetical protein QYQ99_00050 [Comamonas testosteroni]|uniref:hypothetical protein n=1 Tax=Comamonas testosteroni TaxID=285 RepID=UPI00266023AC|nr:hypothetical protein [Comamonas testosteroni]WKL15998.1 hypothetical protein QYQ99_00050 [Comamonas testosteroni]